MKGKIFTLPKIRRNVSLKNYTTFRVGGPAKYFLAANSKQELINAVKATKESRLPFFILGRGGNLLVSDKGYKGLVIKIENSKVKTENCKIKAEAGAIMSQIVELTKKAGLSGLEWAAGIPGTVGGAVCGNAGAFGFSIADTVKNIEVLQFFDSKFKIVNYKKENCRFGYRESIFKKKKNLIILSATFKLKRRNKEEIRKKIKEFLISRRKNQPSNLPSAGSIFKNFKMEGLMAKKLLKKFPELGRFEGKKIIPTGFLIEMCGLKGKKSGQAKISEKHANFIVNLGKARAEEIKKLINFAKEKVKKKFGVVLEEEIRYLGFSTLDNTS